MIKVKEPFNKSIYFKFYILIFLIIIFFILVKFTSISEYTNLETLRNSKEKLRILATLWWSPIIFVLIYILGVIIPFSGIILTLSGGIIFGTFKGTLLNVIASNIGVNIVFFISRYLGRGIVEKFAKGKLKVIDDRIGENGFLTTLRLRFFPILPFNLLNYAFGLSKIKYKDYFWGSLIGMFPATFIFTFFADAILIDTNNQKEAFIKLIIATTFLIALSFIPNILKIINK